MNRLHEMTRDGARRHAHWQAELQRCGLDDLEPPYPQGPPPPVRVPRPPMSRFDCLVLAVVWMAATAVLGLWVWGVG